MRILKQGLGGNTFLELLMDETICQGELWIASNWIREAGGINDRLPAKRKYELVLRLAWNMPVEFEETEEESVDKTGLIRLQDEPEENTKYGWKTDCYITAKYSEYLQKNNCFDIVLESILNEAEAALHYQQTVAFMEQMLGRTEAFFEIDDATRPILIYKGDEICHNVLTVFAEQFGTALEQAGEKVVYFDVGKEDISAITRFTGQRFKAIIGVQTYLFGIKMKDGKHYLHEYIYGPKYNFQFDHPIWGKNYLIPAIKDYHILTEDSNYVEFIQKYYKKDAVFFPPAGMRTEDTSNYTRKYDLTFVGTYGQYREELKLICRMERKNRFMANRFLLIMRKNPHLTAETAFLQMLQYYHLELKEKEFIELFYEMRRVIYCVTHYYREKVLYAILNSGLQLDVFGNSWQTSPLRDYPNLICHPDVTVEESLVVWKQSKISLNIMSWHKAGFTERMANIMLAGAVLVTDDTEYLKNRYDSNDMIVFQLETLEKLPKRIKDILANEEECCRVAENGQIKTRKEHVWDKRAGEFQKILENRRKTEELY